MPYRDFILPNGRKVRTRISDEGTLEWYAQRHESLSKGYPDRPPDIDTENMRQWLGRGGDKEDGIEPGMVSSWPVGTYVLTAGFNLPTFKLLISWLDPGDMYYVRFKAESGIRGMVGSTFFDRDAFYALGHEDALNARIESALDLMQDLAGLAAQMGGEPDWRIATPSEIAEAERQYAEAEADYDAEYGDSEKAWWEEHFGHSAESQTSVAEGSRPN